MLDQGVETFRLSRVFRAHGTTNAHFDLRDVVCGKPAQAKLRLLLSIDARSAR